MNHPFKSYSKKFLHFKFSIEFTLKKKFKQIKSHNLTKNQLVDDKFHFLNSQSAKFSIHKKSAIFYFHHWVLCLIKKNKIKINKPSNKRNNNFFFECSSQYPLYQGGLTLYESSCKLREKKILQQKYIKKNSLLK